MTEASATEFAFDDFGPEEHEDLLAEIDAAFVDIRRGDYDETLARADISPATLMDATAGDLIVQAGKQLGPVEGAIVLILVREGAKLSSLVFTDVWKTILLPRLKSRFGPRIRAR